MALQLLLGAVSSLVSFSAFAQTSFEVGRNTKLQLQCDQAQVKLLKTSSQSLSITNSSTKVTMRKDVIDDVIKVDCNGLDPKMAFTIQGASIPVKINLRNGSVNVQDWSSEIHALVEKGSITTKKTSSNLKLFMTNGQIDVQENQGRLKVKGFNIKLAVSNIEGNSEIDNFMGSTKINNIKGDLSVNARNGVISVIDVTGTVKYNTDNGKLDLAQINGSIEGESDQAQVIIKMQNPARLRAKVKNGNYRIMVPSSSGAQVSMSFEDAQFQVPSFLNQNTFGNTKVVRGNLRGSETGRISLSGDSARVNLQTF